MEAAGVFSFHYPLFLRAFMHDSSSFSFYPLSWLEGLWKLIILDFETPLGAPRLPTRSVGRRLATSHSEVRDSHSEGYDFRRGLRCARIYREDRTGLPERRERTPRAGSP